MSKRKSLLLILLMFFLTIISLHTNIYASGSYTVTFDLGYDTPERYLEVVVDEGDKVVKPTDPTRDGYVFLGWFLNMEKFDFNTPINNDITLSANYELTTYNITYILYEDIPNDPSEFIPLYEEFNIQSNITLNNPSDRVSATFGGWYLNEQYTGEKVDIINGNYINDLTLYARWDKRSHNVKFIVEGIIIQEINVYHSEAIDIFPGEPQKDGYIFYGWVDNDGVHVNESTPVNAAMVLYPLFVEAVDVTFIDEYNDDFIIKIIKGERLPPVQQPTKEHYMFEGWYKDGVEFDFSTFIYEDITLSASWTSNVLIAKLNMRDDLEEYIKNVDEPEELLNTKTDELVDTITENNYTNYETLKTSFKEQLFNLVLDFNLQIYNNYYNTLTPYLSSLEKMYNYYENRIINEDNIDQINGVRHTAITHLNYEYERLVLIDESKTIIYNLVNQLDDINETLILDVDQGMLVFDSLTSDPLIVSYFNYLVKKVLEDSLNIYISDVLNPVSYLNNLINNRISSLDGLYDVDLSLFISEVKEGLLEQEKTEVIKVLNTYKDDISNKGLDIINEYTLLINSEQDIVNIKDILYEGELKVIRRMSLDNTYNEILIRHYELLNYEAHYYRNNEINQINYIIDNLINDYDNDQITTKSLEDTIDDLESVLRYYTDNRIRTDSSIVPEAYEAEGYASSEVGFNKGDKLIVNLVESYYVRNLNLKKMIKNKSIVDKSASRSEKELKNFLKYKRIINFFDIYIIDDNEQEANYEYKMEINLLVPDFLYERPNLAVIYIKDGQVEVYDINQDDGWISFEIDHFSGFYFITDRNKTIIDYWWLVAICITLAAGVTGGLLYKYQKKEDEVNN